MADDANASTARRTSRQRAVAIAIAALLLIAVAGWFVIDSRQDSIGIALHSWEDPANGVISVTVEVDRDPDVALTCELVALDRRHIIVGQLSLDIPPGGERRQRIEAQIPLRGDGIVPDLRGCSRDG